jgi:hypothetical protein
MVRRCITFAGTRVDQVVAIEVLEALRPLGVQAALDALDHFQNQTDEKRRSLEFAFQKVRYEASRIERQYQATEPENRLVAAELEKRWNDALTHVTEMERRVEEASALAPQLTAVFLADTAKHVYLAVRGPCLAKTMSRYLISRIGASPRITSWLGPGSKRSKATRTLRGFDCTTPKPE